MKIYMQFLPPSNFIINNNHEDKLLFCQKITNSVSHQVLNSEVLITYLIHMLILGYYGNAGNWVTISDFFHGSEIQGSKQNKHILGQRFVTFRSMFEQQRNPN